MSTSIPYRKMFAVFAGIFLFLASTSANAIFIGQEIMTPEFARGEFRPMTMVMIPPHAAVSEQSTFSSEQLIEQGGILEDAAMAACKGIFDKLGYELRILTVDEVNADPELQLMVRNVNKRYNEDFLQKVNSAFKGELQDVRSRRFTMGDEARILATRLGVDAIIVGRIQAAAASGGTSIMSMGTSGQAEMSIGVIAGDNGDLEAFFTGSQLGLSSKKLQEKPQETMAKLFGSVLKDYPTPDELVKIKKSWPQSTDRKVPDAVASDEDLLSEFDAMFDDLAEDATPAPDEALPVEE